MTLTGGGRCSVREPLPGGCSDLVALPRVVHVGNRWPVYGERKASNLFIEYVSETSNDESQTCLDTIRDTHIPGA
jgi:hypothetical protein